MPRSPSPDAFGPPRIGHGSIDTSAVADWGPIVQREPSEHARLYDLATRTEVDDPEFVRRLRQGPYGQLRQVRNLSAVTVLLLLMIVVVSAPMAWTLTGAVVMLGLAPAVAATMYLTVVLDRNDRTKLHLVR